MQEITINREQRDALRERLASHLYPVATSLEEAAEHGRAPDGYPGRLDFVMPLLDQIGWELGGEGSYEVEATEYLANYLAEQCGELGEAIEAGEPVGMEHAKRVAASLGELQELCAEALSASETVLV